MELQKDAAGAPVHSIVHTPGPWHAPTDIARGQTRCMVLCNRGDEIARVNHRREEFGADARLIAAAPDLLAACRKALQDIQAYQGGWLDTTEDAEQVLVEAIERATN